MKKTKLKKYLKDLDEGTMVCIGARSSWMYFGPKEDTIEITNRFNEYRDKIAGSIMSIKSELDWLMKTPIYIPKSWGVEDIDKGVTDRYERIYKLVETLHNYEQYIENYKEPLDREVISEYSKSVDGCLGIVIKGEEMGKFWLKSEYDSGFEGGEDGND